MARENRRPIVPIEQEKRRACTLIVNTLSAEIKRSEIRDCVRLLGVVGSRGKTKEQPLSDSDLDLLVVFNNAEKDDPMNSKCVFKFEEFMKKAIKGIDAQNKIPIQVVPTFRVRDIIRAFSPEDTFILHLLTYLSFDSLRKMETTPILRGFAETFEPIYGDAIILQEFKEEKISFHDWIIPLLDILQETYFFIAITPSKMPSKALNEEGFRKLKYVLKYVSSAVLFEKGYDFRDVISETFIIQNLSQLPEGREIVKEVFNIQSENLSMERIKNLYKCAFDFVNSALRDYG